MNSAAQSGVGEREATIAAKIVKNASKGFESTLKAKLGAIRG